MHGGDCVDAVSGGSADEVLCDWCCAGLAGVVLHAFLCEVPAGPDAGVHESGGRSARDRVPYSAVADRGWDGRDSRAGVDGGAAEAVLSAGGADGLYLRQYLRRAGADWSAADCWFVCGAGVSRAEGGVSVDRSVCAVPRVRVDDCDFDPGVLQYERGTGAAADEGDSAAVHLFGRYFDLYHSGQHGCAAEYYARDRLKSSG